MSDFFQSKTKIEKIGAVFQHVGMVIFKNLYVSQTYELLIDGSIVFYCKTRNRQVILLSKWQHSADSPQRTGNNGTLFLCLVMYKFHFTSQKEKKIPFQLSINIPAEVHLKQMWSSVCGCCCITRLPLLWIECENRAEAEIQMGAAPSAGVDHHFSGEVFVQL